MTVLKQISGVVERITFVNPENGFSVIKIKSRGFSELITIVGNMNAINVGSVVKLKGEWKHNSKFGKQFIVDSYEETLPATIAGIERYLGSGLIKGIGPVNAKRIVKHFKEDTIKIIEEEPDRLFEVEGVGKKRVEMIKEAWQEQKEIKNVMIFLQSQGVSTAYAVKIYKAYGNESISIVRENPYRLADDIWGIGFKTADKIARQIGFDFNSYERCRAGIIYILNQLSNDGHCFATREQLIPEAIEMLEIEVPDIITTIEEMIEDKSIILDDEGLYLPALYYSEIGVARRLKEIKKGKSEFNNINIDLILKQVQEECALQYDEIQVKAIKESVYSKIMVLTGGPGTGKTTTTLGIINVFEKMGAKVLLAAPTGRAAKKVAEATGMQSKTIHRLLEYSPQEGYKRNNTNPLNCDAVLIDEVSMVDITLMYNLLKAVKNNTIIILIGDIDQLPSVGPGNVLKDIIDSEQIKTVKLERIFRQAQGSMIIKNAHRINKGDFPILKNSNRNDFFYIEEEDPQEIVEQIKQLCFKRLPSYYKVDPIDDIQVLSPMTRGEVGINKLNEILQKTLNSHHVSVTYGGITYKLGDKVMQIKNNYDKNVFNGDVGRIISINNEDKTLNINFDGNSIGYDITELDELVLAYATTIHKSQGSEYKVVIAPITMQHYIMLQRNLLYTCITRAKNILVLIGTKKAIGFAVRNNKTIERNTKLSQRLTETDQQVNI